jgi:hypothetical protein
MHTFWKAITWKTKREWKDNVEGDLRETGYAEEGELAQVWL